MEIEITEKNNFLWQEFRKYSKFEAYSWLMKNAGKNDINKKIIDSKLINYDYGNFCFQNKELAHIFQWSEYEVKSFLLLIENEGLINKYSKNKYTEIKLLEIIDNNEEILKNEPEKEKIKQNNIVDEKVNIYTEFNNLKMTIAEYELLIELGYSKENIDKTLERLKNYNKKKYKTIYRTCRNWLKRDYPDILKPKIITKPIVRDNRYIELKDYINKQLNKNLKGDDNSEKAFLERLAEGYILDDFKKAIDYLKYDVFAIEKGYIYITIEYITRHNIIEKYSNVNKNSDNIIQVNKSIE